MGGANEKDGERVSKDGKSFSFTMDADTMSDLIKALEDINLAQITAFELHDKYGNNARFEKVRQGKEGILFDCSERGKCPGTCLNCNTREKRKDGYKLLCPECEGLISSLTIVCPHCGKRLERGGAAGEDY